MRPGRLDRIVYVGPPDLEGRKEILRIKTANMSVEPGLDIEELARLVSDPHVPTLRWFRCLYSLVDGWLFRRGDSCALPRSGLIDNERRYQLYICTWFYCSFDCRTNFKAGVSQDLLRGRQKPQKTNHTGGDRPISELVGAQRCDRGMILLAMLTGYTLLYVFDHSVQQAFQENEIGRHVMFNRATIPLFSGTIVYSIFRISMTNKTFV